MQFDADTVGSASPAADAEMCMMAADTMEALGIPRGSYVVKVNNRKVLDGVLESIGLGGEENAGRRLTVLRAIDKLDRLGVEGVRQLLGEGRKDESGDFTKGAGLNDGAIQQILNFSRQAEHFEPIESSPRPGTGLYGREIFSDYESNLQAWEGVVENTTIGRAGIAELAGISNLLDKAGYRDRVHITAEVVRGLEYYTGPIFEVELTFPIEDEKGNPVRFGSVGGGGRYDGLVARFRGEPVPATGFSIGVSRLLAALKHLGKIEDRPTPGPVVVTVFDRDRIADYQRMVQRLRDAPLDPNKPDGPRIRAELYLGNPRNFPNQLKYADRRSSPCVVIQGGDEKNNPAGPHIIVKDLIVGAELAKLEKGREEHLQRQAEAQRLVPEGDLVEAVRAVLSRHTVTWE
jgi:histidyl-tRNA synthetase